MIHSLRVSHPLPLTTMKNSGFALTSYERRTLLCVVTGTSNSYFVWQCTPPTFQHEKVTYASQPFQSIFLSRYLYAQHSCHCHATFEDHLALIVISDIRYKLSSFCTCMISSFRHEVDEICTILGYYAKRSRYKPGVAQRVPGS
jgi:hypothetical protein